ncbi:MAG: hypothetical protein PHU14_09315, partial [Methylovulum sp.]|nr:hypothetical protein [Methylovulum sp.]
GDVLLAKFTQVEPAFEKMVREGRFRNRSVRIIKGRDGLRLGHVGWLGALPPSIEGLKPVEFSSGGNDPYFDFDGEWLSTGITARLFRNIREFIIAQYGQDKADAIVTNGDLDQLAQLSGQQYQDEQQDEVDEPAGADPAGSGDPANFSQHQPQDKTMATQAELDAARREAADALRQVADFSAQSKTLEQQLAAERAVRKRAECQAEIDAHIKRGVKPALLEGAVDFMLHLGDADTGLFEFSVGDGDTKKQTNQRDFFKSILAALPVAVKTGAVDFSQYQGQGDEVVSDFSAPPGTKVDAAGLALHNKALAYMRANAGVNYMTAVKMVGGA